MPKLAPIATKVSERHIADGRAYAGRLSPSNLRKAGLVNSQTEIAISQRSKRTMRTYTIVCTNPPYLNKYDQHLKTYLFIIIKIMQPIYLVHSYIAICFCEPGGYAAYGALCMDVHQKTLWFAPLSCCWKDHNHPSANGVLCLCWGDGTALCLCH